MKISEEEKMMWIEGWRRSGKKAWSYAKENGLIPQTFCNWAKKAEENKLTGFVEVPKQLIPAIGQTPEIIIETGELKIHIPLTVCAAELQKVFASLGMFK